MNINKLYTLETDGTISKWYVFGKYNTQIIVASTPNAKLRDYKKYYDLNDIGKTIFLTRKEARESWRK